MLDLNLIEFRELKKQFVQKKIKIIMKTPEVSQNDSVKRTGLTFPFKNEKHPMNYVRFAIMVHPVMRFRT